MKGAAAALAFVAVLVVVAAPVRAALEIEYLYIDASEGGGSGGHAAIALGNHVFHFEHQAPGILRLRREPVEAVRYRYGVLENRTILASHVPVSRDTYDLVLDELTSRYLVQQQHLADQRAAADDRRLLEAARARQRGNPAGEPLMLEGAGFFFEDSGVPTSDVSADREADGESPPLVALRERVEAVLGPDGLRLAIDRIHAELSALSPAPDPGARVPLVADRLTPSGYGIARRYRDGMLKLLALEALRTAHALRPGSEAQHDLPPLAPEDAALVERLSVALRESLVRVIQSQREDWGFPL
ncbi:MAG TPA: hypothetical protein VMS64_35040, partial [Candidatus Methylomirabilis sp.]|nr:hypothetical protein [Candidatus Methylomirabilis sp.]